MNPNTKVYLNGKLINRTTKGTFKASFAAKLRKLWYYTKVGTAVAALFTGAVFVVASMLATSTVTYAESQPQVLEAKSPVLDRIADCESGNGKAGSATQLKNGQVLISLNTNGTYDQGKYQINSIHNKEASAMGFNLATEEGNTAYAKYLYANKGTGDWSSSSHCWNK